MTKDYDLDDDVWNKLIDSVLADCQPRYAQIAKEKKHAQITGCLNHKISCHSKPN